MKEKFVNLGVSHEKLVEIPNGVDIHRFKPISSGEKLRLRRELGFAGKRPVVFVARQTPVKGIELILEALVIARERLPNIHYIHVGREEEASPFLTNYVKQHQLEGHVTFAGEKTDVLPYLSSSELFVSSSYSEGLSNACLEALASGLPLIATNTGGSREIVDPERNGYILRRRDARELASYLIHLLSDENKRKSFAEASREIATRHFSIEEMIRKYILLYSEVLAG